MRGQIEQRVDGISGIRIFIDQKPGFPFRQNLIASGLEGVDAPVGGRRSKRIFRIFCNQKLEKPFSFQTSRYSEKELDEKAHNFELVPSDGIYVALDYKQSGIGSNSCGPRLAEKYQLREEKIEWEISLRFDNKN